MDNIFGSLAGKPELGRGCNVEIENRMATDLPCFHLILLILVGNNLILYFEREIWLNLRCLGCGYSKPLMVYHGSSSI